MQDLSTSNDLDFRMMILVTTSQFLMSGTQRSSQLLSIICTTLNKSSIKCVNIASDPLKLDVVNAKKCRTVLQNTKRKTRNSTN